MGCGTSGTLRIWTGMSHDASSLGSVFHSVHQPHVLSSTGELFRVTNVIAAITADWPCPDTVVFFQRQANFRMKEFPLVGAPASDDLFWAQVFRGI